MGWALAVLTTASGASQAQPSIPPDLQGWQGWVLEGEAARQCALKDGQTGQAVSDYHCLATTDLDLSPQGDALKFSVRARADLPTLLPLPGGPDQWPRDVTMDGKPAPLRWSGDRWWVALPAGEHQVQGQWTQTPQRLAMPALFARVVWQPEQRPLQRDGTHVWLRYTPEPVAKEDPSAPQVQVFRQLKDGQALQLVTQVTLRLSSPESRLTLGPALPKGFVPIAWTSTTPAVVGPNGMLTVQAARGTHTVTIEARCADPCIPTAEGRISPQALALTTPEGPWPAQEVWSVMSEPSFRQIAVEGQGVDPAEAHVPEEWRAAPAYRVSAAAPLSLKVSSRGRQPGEGEQLTLARETWWTDTGWINRDRLTGTLPVGGRLAMQKPYALGRMETATSLLPLSVDAAGNAGLEWGTPHVDVWAQSTRPHGAAPTTGWNAIVESMAVTLHLPPGSALLAAPGTTGHSGAWLDRFTLLSFFGIALLALLIRQALGNVAALVAALTAAGWIGSGGALLLLWLLALSTALLLASQSIPAGRLHSATVVLRTGLGVLLVLAWIPFAGEQARMAMHPQLAGSKASSKDFPASLTTAESVDESVYGNVASNDAQDAAIMERLPPLPAPVAPAAQRVGSATGKADLSNAVNANDPLAGVGLANVGQPLPTWHTQGQGHHYTLVYPGPLRPMNLENSYAGPHAAGTSRVWVAPTWSIQILRALGTLTLAWLALRLWSRFSLPVAGSLRGRWLRRLGLALCLVPLVSWAQTPDTDAPPVPAGLNVVVSNTPDAATLQALKQRLTQPPACAPTCVALVAVDVEGTDSLVSVTYRLSVEHDATWALPALQGAELVRAQVDGQPAWFAAEHGLVLRAGQTRVVAQYRPTDDRLAMDFRQPPLSVTQRLTGWQLQGTPATGSWVAEKVGATENQPTAETLPAAAPTSGFVHVTRRLTFGATPTVLTTIQRLPGSEAALGLEIPAIQGEAAQSDIAKRHGDAWQVTLPAGQAALRWTSDVTLPTSGEVRLTPISAQQGVETWHIVKGPAWTLSLQGIPESMPAQTDEGLVRQVLPLSGESLVVHAARLPAAPGIAQRIDSVDLATQAGPHDATQSLSFVVTAAQAGERTLTLPPQSEVIDIKVDDQALSLPVNNNQIIVPLKRGEQTVRVTFRSPTSLFRLTTPGVDLGGPASNVHYRLLHTERRWVLLTWGPGWGTAVLYWSQLAVLLLVAYGLTKLPHRPFTLPVALLLVLGFSTLPGTVFWLAGLVAWQAWVAWRLRLADPNHVSHFNLQQVALAGFTAVTLLAVTGAIAYGLLGAQPDMMLRSPPGLGSLEWLVAQTTAGPLVGPVVLSVPMWIYQTLLFLWALWFASWVLQAAKQALKAWLHLGYWKKSAPPPIPPA